MSFPLTEREMYCQHCSTFFTAEGRYVRMSFEDPNDVDFEPEPCCPNCCKHDAIHASDAPFEEKYRRNEELLGDILDDWRMRCRTCNVEITSAELCAECAEGNDPFVTSKYNEPRRY